MLRELRNRGAATQKSRTKTPDLEPPNKGTSFVCHGILDGEEETLSEKRETTFMKAHQHEKKKPLYIIAGGSGNDVCYGNQ